MKKLIVVLIFLCGWRVGRSQWSTSGSDIYFNTGNVSIGTNTPLELLTVSGNAIADKFRLYHLTTPSVGAGIFAPAASTFGVYTNSSERLRVDGSGNVGIGTTTPQAMLDVNGQVNSPTFMLMNPTGNLNDNVLRSTYSSTQFDLIGTYNGWDPNGVFIAGYNAASASPATKAAQKVYIGSPFSGTNDYVCVNFMTGTVGIGTNNTGSNKLAVEGTIGARKVVVTQTSPFPDYVFAPGYPLMSLDSLRRFVKANRHLPGIPSAGDVEKNGLDLGDNQTTMVKKLEELTLYIMGQDALLRAQDGRLREAERVRAEQDRKIEELSRRMEEMERKMEKISEGGSAGGK